MDRLLTGDVLFLDDDPYRTEVFKSLCPHATTTDTATGCISYLSGTTSGWGSVCLDHDLGGEIYVDPSHPNTGSAVVRWVKANRPKVGLFVVHTLNGEAAEAMVMDLALAGYDVCRAPFGQLIKSIQSLRAQAQPPQEELS